MEKEEGFVQSTTGNGWAQVVTERKDACAGCGASHCCASFGSSSEMVIKALNRVGAKVGDLVSVSLSSGTVVKDAAVLYLIPVAGLMAGVLIAAGLSGSLPIGQTGAVTVFGFAGLILGFIITALISRWMSAHDRLTPVITRIIKPGVPGRESFTPVDPVCKMTVSPNKTPASFTHKAKTYYFCNPVCREAFIKEPEKYI